MIPFKEAAELAVESLRHRVMNRPQLGFWMIRMRRGGPEMPACIALSDHEPGNAGNKLDTGPILVANVGYEERDPIEVWSMKGRAITEAEYRFEMARVAWVRAHAMDEPEATPRKPVDLAALRPIGPEE